MRSAVRRTRHGWFADISVMTIWHNTLPASSPGARSFKSRLSAYARSIAFRQRGHAAVRCSMFPPMTVFEHGTSRYLADGFQRLEAHRAAGRSKIEADVLAGTREDAPTATARATAAAADVLAGTREDALWCALGANRAHGRTGAQDLAGPEPAADRRTDRVLIPIREPSQVAGVH